MAKRSAEKAEAMRLRLNLTHQHLLSIRFAINVGIASVLVWQILALFGDNHPIWAIASMVAASEPQPSDAKHFFRSRIINVLVGCAVGLFFMLTTGANIWSLPLALATTVLLSSLVIKVKTMWRQAPITAAVVIAAGITSSSTKLGIAEGLHKVGEVLFGCIIGLLVSWVMSKVWFIEIKKEG